jgi:hypothetical protein
MKEIKVSFSKVISGLNVHMKLIEGLPKAEIKMLVCRRN